jgi:hypothetical protein
MQKLLTMEVVAFLDFHQQQLAYRVAEPLLPPTGIVEKE